MKTNFITLVSVFIAGAAAGTAVALLNASRPGKETQAQLREGISEAGMRTKEAISDVQARTMAKMDEVKQRVKEIGDEAKQIPEKLVNTKITIGDLHEE
ncbi:MAG TPA: YtxH domain-containing protein [Anaerolineales bacterium]|nr:YtxH domain-containing protein [Anaerolineales bacterium]